LIAINYQNVCDGFRLLVSGSELGTFSRYVLVEAEDDSAADTHDGVGGDIRASADAGHSSVAYLGEPQVNVGEDCDVDATEDLVLKFVAVADR
jgi:hypothetical protein